MTCRLTILLSLLLAPILTLAAVNEIPVSEADKIIISVGEAQINVVTNPQSKSFRLTLSEGAQEEFAIERRDRQLRVVLKNQGNREDLAKFSNKKRSIDLIGPSVPLDIHLFEGQVMLSKWTKDALVHVQKGKVILKENSGAVTAHVQKGEIQALDHQGKLTIDSYAANAVIKNLNGDLNLENFSGDSVIEKAKGAFSLNQSQGSLKISGSSGSMNFEVGKAQLQSLGFAGRIEGQTQDGAVVITMGPESEVRVRSQSGRVTVSGAGIGAYVNVASVEGDVFAPNYMKVNRDSTGKSLRGRLRGDVQKGSISVRSQEGAIVIK